MTWNAIDTRILSELPAEVYDRWPAHMRGGALPVSQTSAPDTPDPNATDTHLTDPFESTQVELVYGLAAMFYTTEIVVHTSLTGALNVECVGAVATPYSALLLRIDEPNDDTYPLAGHVLARVVRSREVADHVSDLIPRIGQTSVTAVVRPTCLASAEFSDVPVAVTGTRADIRNRVRDAIRARILNAAMYVNETHNVSEP